MKATADAIKTAVARAYGLPVESLDARTRNPVECLARQVAMWMCRTILGLSYPLIGMEFADRDHSTIIGACQEIDRRLTESPALRGKISSISESLGLGAVLRRVVCPAFLIGRKHGRAFDFLPGERRDTDLCRECRRIRREHLDERARILAAEVSGATTPGTGADSHQQPAPEEVLPEDHFQKRPEDATRADGTATFDHCTSGALRMIAHAG